MFTAMAAVFGGASSPGARYWRIYLTEKNGGWPISFANVEMRESKGGADVTGGGAATASSTAEGLPANAFDSSNTSYWAVTAALPQWLKYDFGAGVKKAIVELQLRARDDSYNYQWPKSFQLQYSDDDVAWNTLFSIAGDVQTIQGGTRVYSAPVVTNAKHWWRIYVTAKNDSYCSASDVGFRTAPGGPSVATGGVGTSTALFDGDPGTFYYTNIANPVFEYNWGYNQGKEIVEFSYTVRNDPFYYQAPRDFELQYSTDGVNWTTVKTVTNQTGWTQGETRVFAV